ncbi:MAG: hypothetical protein DHS20C15_20440 [Planctomycetota bacterium]|nr:MAG: hypothetical protein DHS20C15_20440 [Planctomycetota bacterium]
MPVPSSGWQARVLALLLLAATLFGVWEAALGENDFDGFHAGARALLDSGEFSTAKAVQRYPPSFQLLMLPFALLPLWLAGALFTLLSLAALADLPRRLEQLSGVSLTQQSWAWWAVLPFTLDVLRLGQNGLVLLWLVVTGLLLLRRGGAVLGGALLTLAALVKVLPLAFLFVPVVLRRGGRGLLGAALCTALIVSAAALGPGLDESARATQEWSQRSSAEQTPWALVSVGRSVRYNNQGLGVVLGRTFGEMGPPRKLAKGAVQLAALPMPVVWTLYGVCMLLAAVALLAAVIAAHRVDDPARRGDASRAWSGLLAAGCCAVLLASPLVWTHYFLWLAPALVFLHARPVLRRCAPALIWLGLALPQARGLGVHMWITFALLLLVTLELERRPAREALRPRSA